MVFIDIGPKQDPEAMKKYYFTYSLGGIIEGKSDYLSSGDQRWFINQDILVTKDLLISIYQKPSEIVLWEVGMQARKTKKEEVVVKEKRSTEKNSNTIANSVGNTVTKPKLKTQGKFVNSNAFSKTIPTEARNQKASNDPLLWRKNSISSSELVDKPKTRPSSTSSLHSRPVSANPEIIDLQHRTGQISPAPHHYDHPEKHVDPALIKTGMVRSRTSSLTNEMKKDRPRTPPSPHHHRHPLKTIRKEDAKNLRHKKPHPDSAKKTNMRWIGSASSGNSVNWDSAAIRNAARQENDHEIKSGQANITRKKGEAIHSIVDRIVLDTGLLFLDISRLNGKIQSDRLNLSDCIYELSLETLLLTQERKKLLNPITVKLGTAKGMPSSPIAFEDLDEISEPIYASFKFFNDPFVHTSILNEKHKSSLVFNSTHVILPGLIDSHRLVDELHRNRLVVEIHDRDYKYVKDSALKNSKFFEGGIIQCNLNPSSPYGQATFDLSDFAKGKKSIAIETSVLPSPRLGREQSRGSILQGKYFESSTVFSIEMSISESLLETASRPLFSHIAVSCRENYQIVKDILDFVRDFNFASLGLKESLTDTKDAALGSFMISPDEKSQKQDILGGYHIYDSSIHFFFIEGLEMSGLSKMEEFLQSLKDEPSFSFAFSSIRNYHRQRQLNSPTLLHIALKSALNNISSLKKVAQLGNKAQECISLLNTVCMANIEKRSLAVVPCPSLNMIVPLLKVYGSVKTLNEVMQFISKQKRISAVVSEFVPYGDSEDAAAKEPIADTITKSSKSISNLISSQVDNAEKPRALSSRRLKVPNFVARNARRNFVYVPCYTCSTEITVFNYSTQKLSTLSIPVTKREGLMNVNEFYACE